MAGGTWDDLGPLAAVAVPGVTDILVNGPGQVWVDGPDGLRRAAVSGLESESRVRALAQRLAAMGGRRLDEAAPFVDARLPGGIRVHAVLPALARSGTHISLRIPAAVPLSLDDLTRSGSVTDEIDAALRELVTAREGFVVSGVTGSGKTTVLGAVLGLVPSRERLVVVEDTAELGIDHAHVVYLESRPANVEGAGAIGMDVLVRQALRMRPDRIVVGECRGREVRDLLAALGTGHCGATTVHAAGPAEVLPRISGLAETAGLDPHAAAAALRSGVGALVHVDRGPAGRHVTGVWRLADAGEPVPMAVRGART